MDTIKTSNILCIITIAIIVAAGIFVCIKFKDQLFGTAENAAPAVTEKNEEVEE